MAELDFELSASENSASVEQSLLRDVNIGERPYLNVDPTCMSANCFDVEVESEPEEDNVDKLLYGNGDSFYLTETKLKFKIFLKSDDTSSLGSYLDSSEENLSNSCEEDLSDSDKISGAVKGNSNLPLYFGSPLTTSTSIVLIMSFVQKHRLTGEAFADLLALIEAHCPKPNNCKVTVNGAVWGNVRESLSIIFIVNIVKDMLAGVMMIRSLIN